MKHWAFWFQISLFGLENVPLFSPQKVQKICVWRVTIYFEHFDVFAFWKFLESCDTEAVVSQAKLSQHCYFLPTTGWLVQIVKKLFQGHLRVCVCLLLLHNIVAESERLKKKDWMARVWLLVRMLYGWHLAAKSTAEHSRLWQLSMDNHHKLDFFCK